MSKTPEITKRVMRFLTTPRGDLGDLLFRMGAYLIPAIVVFDIVHLVSHGFPKP